MRVWRDVISVRGWEVVMEKTDSTAHISATTSIKAAFDKTVETPKRTLREIHQKLQQYHSIPKDQLGQIQSRINSLLELRKLGFYYLDKYRVDLDKAEERAMMKPANSKDVGYLVANTNVNKWDKSPYTGQYMSGNPKRESLDRNVLTLCRRSARKAQYLKVLYDYHNGNARANPLALIQYLNTPKDEDSELTGLSPGVRMESEDPLHRPMELHMKNGAIQMSDGLEDPYSITTAFSQWASGVTATSAPFFLWLENHPICLADDKDMVSETRSVFYGNAVQGNAPPIGKVQLVRVGNPCMSMALTKNAALSVCDTSNYVSANRKGGQGAAAFIWTREYQLFIGQHSEGTFHHSSFISGQMVRCAGMIKILSGKVTFVTNNSGHYKPGKDKLKNFLEWLHQSGAVSADTEILCLGKQDFEGTLKSFMFAYATL